MSTEPYTSGAFAVLLSPYFKLVTFSRKTLKIRRHEMRVALSAGDTVFSSQLVTDLQ
jgi:hypothetical protein